MPIPATAGTEAQRKEISDLETKIADFEKTFGTQSATACAFLLEQRARLAQLQEELVTTLSPEERVAAAQALVSRLPLRCTSGVHQTDTSGVQDTCLLASMDTPPPSHSGT